MAITTDPPSPTLSQDELSPPSSGGHKVVSSTDAFAAAPSPVSATVPVPVAAGASSPTDTGTVTNTNTTTTTTTLSFLFSVIAVGLAVAALGVAVKKDSSLSKPPGPSSCSNLHWAGLFHEDGWLGGVAFSGEDQLVEWRPDLTPDYGEGDIYPSKRRCDAVSVSSSIRSLTAIRRRNLLILLTVVRNRSRWTHCAVWSSARFAHGTAMRCTA